MSTESRQLTPAREAVIARLATSLGEAVSLLSDAEYPPAATVVAEAEEATLLQQCLALCEEPGSAPIEPVRLIHHLACTGGTLICKCLGVMPNVQLLSEVDPLSPLWFKPEAPRFAPTDMNRLIRQGTRGADTGLLVDLFQAEMRVLHRHAVAMGHHLVIRDHPHSHYCTGPRVPERPRMLDCLPPELPALSVLTVRHPADSFASLVDLESVHFEPANFAEYCRRCLTFLDAYAGTPCVRYEDFVADPATTLQFICRTLALDFNPEFADLFGVMHLTGDSGRTSSSGISTRPSRQLSTELRAASKGLEDYGRLLDRLGYARDA